MLRAAETQPGWLRGLSALGIPQRPALVVLSVTGLSCLYLLYAHLVNPLVQVQSVGRLADRGNRLTPAPPQLVTMASRHLPSQPWAADASIQFRTRDAFVYAEKWEQVESDRAVRFTPFAMIWTEHETDDAPVAVWCRSAIVRFADAFDRSNPRPTRVVGGSMQGDVHLTGPRGLDVVGRNFEFSEKSGAIWSDHQVEFAYDGHRGSAHGVQIELLTASEPDSETTLSIVGISKIQLRQNVDLDLTFQGDPREETTTRRASEPQDEEREEFHVQVRSAGSFEYFVDTNLATFSEDVRVYRPTGEEQYDLLQCELLTLVFKPEAESETPGPQGTAESGAEVASATSGRAYADDPDDGDETEEFRGLDSNLTFQRMRAQGQRVVLVSDANEFTAHMSDFIYDAQRRVAAMTSGQYVRVMHRTSELNSPEITIVHDEQGEVTSSWCRGAGWLRHHDADTGEVVLAGQWARQLVRFRESDTGLDVIEFDQQAVLQHPLQKVGLAAESIKIWLADLERETESELEGIPPRVETKSNRPVSGSSRSRNAGPANAERNRYQPRRLLAHTKVAVASPQFQGETERLEIWFEPAQSSAASSPNAQPDPATTPEAQDGPQPAEPPRDEERTDPQYPLEVLSDLIQVRVQLGTDPQEDLLVSDIVSEGHVDIRQQHEDGASLRLTGQRLKLRNENENRQVLHVYGDRAHIWERALHIEGEEIHFDRARNLAWVSGAGLLQLPVDQTLEGEPLDEPRLIDILWSEQMTFDGQTGRFFGNVRTVLADNQMQCQEMHVLLTRKLSFSEGESLRSDSNASDGRPAVDLHSIVCNDRVQFRGYEYENSKLIAIRHARCAHASLNQVTGDSEVSGPGTITVWQRGKARRGSLSPSATARANQPLESRDAEWEYTKVEFVGKANGNLKQRFTKFHDQVRIVYGPVDRPDGVIDPEDLPDGQFPENSGLMRCDVLQLTQHQRTDSHAAHVELLATGNAILEGRTFHAQADTISYDESKEQYVLRSIEPRKATIWVQETPAARPSSAQGQSIKFSPVHKQLKVDRATGFQGVR